MLKIAQLQWTQAGAAFAFEKRLDPSLLNLGNKCHRRLAGEADQARPGGRCHPELDLGTAGCIPPVTSENETLLTIHSC
jgi:hypothetical protein